MKNTRQSGLCESIANQNGKPNNRGGRGYALHKMAFNSCITGTQAGYGNVIGGGHYIYYVTADGSGGFGSGNGNGIGYGGGVAALNDSKKAPSAGEVADFYKNGGGPIT